MNWPAVYTNTSYRKYMYAYMHATLSDASHWKWRRFRNIVKAMTLQIKLAQKNSQQFRQRSVTSQGLLKGCDKRYNIAGPKDILKRG